MGLQGKTWRPFLLMKNNLLIAYTITIAAIAVIIAIAEHKVRKDAEYYVTCADISIKNNIVDIEEAKGKIAELEDELEDIKNYYTKHKPKKSKKII
jgi:hypothetical protein